MLRKSPRSEVIIKLTLVLIKHNVHRHSSEIPRRTGSGAEVSGAGEDPVMEDTPHTHRHIHSRHNIKYLTFNIVLMGSSGWLAH